ncbi:MAG TPA: carboxypeptidase regulatory-like domain-containing protein, partial [bacterium]|nr:carboxypeptidase regulatory-like domain-containing protein [bacterium]
MKRKIVTIAKLIVTLAVIVVVGGIDVEARSLVVRQTEEANPVQVMSPHLVSEATYTISGWVTDSDSSSVEGVTIEATRKTVMEVFLPLVTSGSGHIHSPSSTDLFTLASETAAVYTTTTDTNGYYTLNDLPKGAYTLVPYETGSTFSPEMRTASVPPSLDNQNFVRQNGGEPPAPGEMVNIPAGEFQMGCDDTNPNPSENCYKDDEQPLHTFYLD